MMQAKCKYENARFVIGGLLRPEEAPIDVGERMKEKLHPVYSPYVMGYECERCHRPIKVLRANKQKTLLNCPYCRFRGKMNKRVKIQRFFHPQPLTEVFKVISGFRGKGIINEVIMDWAIANVQNCKNVRYLKRVRRANSVREIVPVYCHEVPENEKCDWCRGLIQNIPLSKDAFGHTPRERQAFGDNV